MHDEGEHRWPVHEAEMEHTNNTPGCGRSACSLVLSSCSLRPCMLYVMSACRLT